MKFFDAAPIDLQVKISQNNYHNFQGYRSIQRTRAEMSPEKPTLSLTSPSSRSSSSPSSSTVNVNAPKREFAENPFFYKNLMDRTVGVSSRETGLVEEEFKFAYRETADPDLTNTDVELTSEDLLFLRSSVEHIVSRNLIITPDATVDDVESWIDGSFGSGVASVLAPEKVDMGDGYSEIRIAQKDVDEYSLEEKAVIALGVETAKSAFIAVKEDSPQLNDVEFESLVKEFERNVGPGLIGALSDFNLARNSNQPGGTAQAIEDLRVVVEDDTTLRQGEKSKLINVLERMKTRESEQRSSVINPPLLEDLNIRFISGYSRRAFTRDEVAELIDS